MQDLCNFSATHYLFSACSNILVPYWIVCVTFLKFSKVMSQSPKLPVWLQNVIIFNKNTSKLVLLICFLAFESVGFMHSVCWKPTFKIKQAAVPTKLQIFGSQK